MSAEQIKELSKEIERLDLSYNYHINQGGCGFFAAMLVIKLKQLGYNAVPVYAAPYIDEVREAYENDSYSQASHVFVTVYCDYEEIHFDSDGYTYDQYEMCFISAPLLETDEEFVMRSTFLLPEEDSWIWNPAFNKNNLPEIERKIDSAIYQVFGKRVKEISNKYLNY